MKYDCICCNYSTNDKGNWSKHKKSLKHIKNSNKVDKTTTSLSDPNPTLIRPLSEGVVFKKYICQHCGEVFSVKGNLSRHLKYCKQNEYKLLQKEYEKYKKDNEADTKIKILEEKLKSCQNHIEILKTENKFQKQLIESAGGMIKKSMNTMSYLLLNYNDAPQLEALNDYSAISENTQSLIENLIHYNKQGKIDKFIGDFIIRQYKKDDPKFQSIWSSDIERLNYFIRELINNNPNQQESKVELTNKSLNWLIDKKGIKVEKNIIEPLLNYIHDIGVKYLNEKAKEIDTTSADDAVKIISKMQEIGEINCGIRNKTISNNINKYIAPHFFLNK
ncbi:hypothetical protein Catovirus_1_424 [Catovirus CTV1]|uniref:C2H2-type domain-containing protein n=1 Tax=Catovirus CTV1 TaxID=1977631 RepID=A0A1V0S9L4_9VIRU|nr:hypothetical protein Catovirus_1_424 [Catovirus CTV1]